MTHEIKASWDTLMQQSKDTTWGYFGEAHKILEGSDLKYTAADVVALAKVMATDFHTASMGVATQKLCEALTTVGWGLDSVADVMREANAE
jgi:hypothetical protein